MEKLRKLPPPTLEEVQAQFYASAHYYDTPFGHGKRRFKDRVLEGCKGFDTVNHIIR